MYEFERKNLINELSQSGITDFFVLTAISMVPREKFVPDALQDKAYQNTALPIGKGQTISQPYTVAFMMQELRLKKGMKILEIGTGSGYQAALLKAMGLKVFSIERNYDLYISTLKLLETLNYPVICRYGDGTIGWEEYAPYDGIIVTAGAPALPKSLIQQLSVGGRLVCPVGTLEYQEMFVVYKEDEDKLDINKIPNFRFVPLIGSEGWSKG